jgi:hypothetical protein
MLTEPLLERKDVRRSAQLEDVDGVLDLGHGGDRDGLGHLSHREDDVRVDRVGLVREDETGALDVAAR